MVAVAGRLLMLALALALPVLASGPASAKRVALVVGNDAYENVAPLQKAVSDARSMAGTLEALGFTVVSAIDVDRTAMSQKIFEFTSRIDQNDEALLFFAGHGVRHEGRNYLLPVDVPKVQPGGADLVADGAFAADDIGERMRRRSPRVSVMILDACRDNPFVVEGADGTRSAFGGTRGLSRMAAPVGTFIMFSAGEGERALDRVGDNDPDPNSLFTRNLIRAMSIPGRSLLDVAKDVQSEVYEQARAVSHEQAPAIYDRILGDYCLAPGPGGRCGAGGGSGPAPGPEAQPSACRDLLFGQALQIGSEAALNAFLAGCHEGPQAALARAALAKLRQENEGAGRAALERRIRDFVTFSYIKGDFGNAAAMRELFAPRVDYYNKGVVGADEVVADKNAYAARWVSLDYELVDGSLVLRRAEPVRYKARFRARFRAENAEQVVTGISETDLGIVFDGDRPMIEAEKSRVIEREVAAVGPPAAFGAGGQAAASFWDHNGSLMYLVADGPRRWFYYERPRSGIVKAGARPGTLLFEGNKVGNSYEGTAYVFSASCGPIGYRVSGPIENGARRVVLYGKAPVRGADCRVARNREDRLVFDFLSKTRP